MDYHIRDQNSILHNLSTHNTVIQTKYTFKFLRFPPKTRPLSDWWWYFEHLEKTCLYLRLVSVRSKCDSLLLVALLACERSSLEQPAAWAPPPALAPPPPFWRGKCSCLTPTPATTIHYYYDTLYNQLLLLYVLFPWYRSHTFFCKATVSPSCTAAILDEYSHKRNTPWLIAYTVVSRPYPYIQRFPC